MNLSRVVITFQDRPLSPLLSPPFPLGALSSARLYASLPSSRDSQPLSSSLEFQHCPQRYLVSSDSASSLYCNLQDANEKQPYCKLQNTNEKTTSAAGSSPQKRQHSALLEFQWISRRDSNQINHEYHRWSFNRCRYFEDTRWHNIDHRFTIAATSNCTSAAATVSSFEFCNNFYMTSPFSCLCYSSARSLSKHLHLCMNGARLMDRCRLNHRSASACADEKHRSPMINEKSLILPCHVLLWSTLIHLNDECNRVITCPI